MRKVKKRLIPMIPIPIPVTTPPKTDIKVRSGLKHKTSKQIKAIEIIPINRIGSNINSPTRILVMLGFPCL